MANLWILCAVLADVAVVDHQLELQQQIFFLYLFDDIETMKKEKLNFNSRYIIILMNNYIFYKFIWIVWENTGLLIVYLNQSISCLPDDCKEFSSIISDTHWYNFMYACSTSAMPTVLIWTCIICDFEGDVTLF
jgi:hypothetical protein